MAVAVLSLISFLLLNFHLIAAAVVPSQMQRRLVDDSGFIGIDCGLGAGSYYLSGLHFTSDDKYISSGKNMGISPTFYSELRNDLFKTVRSFPEGGRNCYNLHPLQRNKKYLIRPWFMYGNYDGQSSIPGFDLYTDVNFWDTVSLRSMNTRLFMEIIHMVTTESIDVCLVNTGQGTPFISALEVVLMDSSPYPASANFSLIGGTRMDIGGLAKVGAYYELTDDPYLRAWFLSPQWGWRVINTSASFDNTNPCKVPKSVLRTAGEQNNGLANITDTFTMNSPIDQAYAFWHFAELNQSLGSNEIREFNIFAPGYTHGPITPKYLQVTTVSSPPLSLNGSNVFWYTLMKTNKSTLNPIINAVEVYTVLNLPVSPTNQVDADAIAEIKDAYQVPRVWQGDPCLPVNYQWEGLNCTYNDNNPPTISSLSLPSSSLTGDLPPSLSNLTSLKYLNLSNNGFTGTIPEFLAYLPSLDIIDLTGNNLTGPVPLQLAEKASNKSIELRLAGNPYVCNSYPCEGKTERNQKRHHFIIPVVTCVALVSLFVVISIIFLAFKWRKKQGSVSVQYIEALADQGIKSKNKQFKSSDIERVTGNYKEIIGRGGFATVYYGVLEDGVEVAVKLLNNVSSTITMKQFRAEAELLTRIHHVNLVSLIGYCDEHAIMALMYEYMSCGNLQMHLSERNEHPLSWKVRFQISVDAAQGLDYLHSGCQPPIIHRDIKPANILLDEMGHAKIADFGLSRFFIDKTQVTVSMTDVAGTRGYLDPEYCQLNTFNEKSDVYGFGIVLLQLLTGKEAFIKDPNNEDPPIHIINWVSPFVESGDIMAIVDKRVQGDFGVNSAWKFLEIAMECVKPTGIERPRMSEVVADLKMCYEFEGCHDQSLVDGGRALDHQSLVSLPSAR